MEIPLLVHSPNIIIQTHFFSDGIRGVRVDTDRIDSGLVLVVAVEEEDAARAAARRSASWRWPMKAGIELGSDTARCDSKPLRLPEFSVQ